MKKLCLFLLISILLFNSVSTLNVSGVIRELCSASRFPNDDHKQGAHLCPQSAERDAAIFTSERITAASLMYGAVISHGLHGFIYLWYMSTFERALPMMLALMYCYLSPIPLRTGAVEDPYQSDIGRDLSQICIYEWLFCPKSFLYRAFQLLHLTAVLQLTFYFCFLLTTAMYSKSILTSKGRKGPVNVLPRDPWARQVPFLFILCAIGILYDFSNARWVYPALLPVLLVFYNLQNCFWLSFQGFLWQIKQMALYAIFSVPIYHVLKVANFSTAKFKEYYSLA